MGLEEEKDTLYEEDEAVTRRECALHRQVINSRVGGIEKELTEIKYEQRIMKECLDKFMDMQSTNWTKLYLIVIAILILVAAGRIFDVDAWLGMIP